MSLTLTIYTDYICPFCYLHEAVVSALLQDEAITPEWRCIEIYPDTPAEGKPLRREGRYAAKWDAWVEPFCTEFNIELQFPSFLPNTHQAALATALAGEFGHGNAVHGALLKAYWRDHRNIGDPVELERILDEAGLAGIAPSQWQTDECEALLTAHRTQSYDDMATGFPTTMLGAFPLMGLQSPQDFRTQLARYRKVLARESP